MQKKGYMDTYIFSRILFSFLIGLFIGIVLMILYFKNVLPFKIPFL